MKLNHILFAVDFSENSRRLNYQVEWLAQKFQSQVTLLHVFEIPVSWYSGMNPPIFGASEIGRLRDAEQKRLKDYQLNVPEPQVNRVLLQGGAAWQLTDWAETHPTDLIVMGTRGLSALSRIFMGSVAMNVLHGVNCPVWTEVTADAAEFRGIEKIVCPIELTDEAVPLLRFVKQVSEAFGAKVCLTHAIPAGAESYPFVDVHFQRHLEEWAKNEVEKRQTEAGTNFPLAITSGTVEHDIGKIAADERADLMVIGRGRSQKILGALRTHAYEIIRHVRCPVLSYSTHWHGEETVADMVTSSASPTTV